MIKIKPVGVRKDRGWLMPIFLFIIVASLAIDVVFWWRYCDEYKYEYLVNNGIEVEATIVDYDFHYESYADGDLNYASGWFYIWECYYNGRRYWGNSGTAYFTSEEEVLRYLGTTFTVTVDPNSNWVMDRPISEISPNGFFFKEYLTAAIVFTCLTPVIIFVLVWRMLYPLILDDKIDKCGIFPIEGEVVKTRSWIVSYVKVKYKDEKGEVKEKWSYSWVTRREAKFLKEKKYIQIVPYKNTYGILEEMAIEKK